MRQTGPRPVRPAARPDSPHLLRPARVAEILDVAVRTLESWRARGVGPGYVRLPGGRVRYPKAVLLAWIEERDLVGGRR
jgi:predicted site-specific integrase-resolvase